ncbi:MAG: hypothetical protein GOU97_03580 [Nanoarchaeota archaeon]|nr:hypothetical protein [Nanoarchaeota archaeon]
MEEESKEFKPYVLGTSIGLAEGGTPVKGLQSAINWGSPVVQLEGSPANVGRTGLQVIKELAKHNKVKLSWHSPPSQDWELAYPDKEKNELAARQYDLLLTAAKTTGTELINTHVTYAIPKISDDKILVYDEDEKHVGIQRIPALERKKIEEAKGPEEIKKIRQGFIDMLNKDKVTGLKQNLEYHKDFSERYRKNEKQFKELTEMLETLKPDKGHKTLLKIGPYHEQVREVIRSLNGKDINISSEEGWRKGKELLEKEKDKFYERANAEDERVKFLEDRYGERLKTGKFYSLGFKAVVDNFADKFAPIVAKAMKKGIKISVENTDARYMFSTPDEILPALEALYKKLGSMGYSESKIREYVGYCFDYGHANTISGLKIGGKTIGPPIEQVKKVTDKFPLMHVHYHENFGDVDAHMPVGESTKEGEEYDKKLKELKKFLAEKNFKGDVVHEIGMLGGLGYQVSLQRAYPGLEYSSSGAFTPGFSAPTFSYVAGAHEVDPIHLDKQPHYFYSTWMGGQVLP